MIDYFGANTDALRHFIYLLSLHLPRTLIFVFFFPLFGKGLGAGGFLKIAISGAILLAPVSALVGVYERAEALPAITLVTVVGEVIIGTLLGLTMAMPYFAFKAYGALIDVYRGATFAAQATGTDTGSEELPLETLFGLMFVALVFTGPGLSADTTHLLKSYIVLPPGSIDVMALRPWSETVVQMAAEHVAYAFILAAPILIVILIVEVAMQILSAFTPQMQIYSLQFGFRSIAAIGALIFFLAFSEDEILSLITNQSNTLNSLIDEGAK